MGCNHQKRVSPPIYDGNKVIKVVWRVKKNGLYEQAIIQ
jgi:hypothetical protein